MSYIFNNSCVQSTQQVQTVQNVQTVQYVQQIQIINGIPMQVMVPVVTNHQIITNQPIITNQHNIQQNSTQTNSNRPMMDPIKPPSYVSIQPLNTANVLNIPINYVVRR